MFGVPRSSDIDGSATAAPLNLPGWDSTAFHAGPHDFDARAHCCRSVTRPAVRLAAPVIDLHEEEQRIDLNELVDAPDVSPPPDTVARLVSDLGAQVVDAPRD